jgi:hypothetical protein
MARGLSKYEKAWRERSGHAVQEVVTPVPPKASVHPPSHAPSAPPKAPTAPVSPELARPAPTLATSPDDDELERLTAPRPPTGQAPAAPTPAMPVAPAPHVSSTPLAPARPDPAKRK